MQLILVLCIITVVHAEVFTALSDLENLLYTEAELIGMMNQYITAEEKKLDKMKSFLAEYEAIHTKASDNKEKFLSNPVNAYLLVKRLTRDWRSVETAMVENVGQTIIDNRTAAFTDLPFPDEEDLSGAAAALMRLQDTYKLDTSYIARGVIGDDYAFKELSAGDCFELGRQSYNNQDYYHTVLWMNEALHRAELESSSSVQREDILEYLAFSTYQQGNVERALKLTEELLSIVPNHPRATGNKDYYETTLRARERRKRGDDGEYYEPEKENSEQTGSGLLWNLRPTNAYPEREQYERLCRGERLMPEYKRSQLKCRYFTGNHPFLMIAPVKEEEANLDPRISIYHEIITNNEIEAIEELAQPRLRRATVQNYKTGELETANYRISKSAWLKTNEHPLIQSLVNRISQVTGLNMDTAEELQVANYGIGGHYEPHFDFARREETNAFKSLGTGNRIATWLNYMSDVSAGGATVFPNLGVSLWPRKGTAAFWFNLYRNGEGDLRTRHAACPVLAGVKWVSNKWFHERGQEWFRPCALNPEE